MNELRSFWIEIFGPASSTVAVISFTTVYMVILVFLMLKLPLLRQSFQMIFSLFLYNENREPSREVDDIAKLRAEIDKLQKAISDPAIKTEVESFKNRISKYFDENFDSLLQDKLNDPEIARGIAISRLDETLAHQVEESLSKYEPAAILENRFSLMRHERDESVWHLLEKSAQQERQSSAMLKTVMINIFVIFTFCYIGSYLAFGENFPSIASYILGASYISLAAFIIYIVRTSHYRTGVLLAIRENLVNQLSAQRFIESDKCSTPLSENDVDVIRMLLTNRTEREHQANHPYEVILKNVQGTNVQFKVGKISLGKRID